MTKLMEFEVGDIVRIVWNDKTHFSQIWNGQEGVIEAGGPESYRIHLFTPPYSSPTTNVIHLFTPPYSSPTTTFPAEYLEHI